MFVYSSFQLSVVEPKPVTNDTGHPMKQSKLKTNCERVTIGFTSSNENDVNCGFTSDWMTKGRKFF